MGRADGNAIQADAEEDDEPDGVDGGLGVWVYLGEEAGWFVVLTVYLAWLDEGLVWGTYDEKGRASSRAKA